MRAHSWMGLWLLPAAVFVGGAAVAAEQAAPVRVWQDVLALPTSAERLPDPNPPFEQFRGEDFQCYPYSIRDRLAPERAVTRWRAVILENRYLRCIVLPDLGGHVYSCVDKVSGRSIFYDNRSIKKALVSYRGAWAAFGLEFNFPVSHNYVSVSPVDFSYGLRPDGSAMVVVGNVDRVDSMQWIVQLVLQPDRAVLEQHVTLVNRDAVRHRYYWWTNAAVEVWDDSRIEYPMRFSEGHGLADIDTWPVDSHGVDLSVVGNHRTSAVSRFVHGSREPFCGVYHPSNHTGVVHYSDWAQVPAKKIWSWSSNARGMRFRTALSGDNSAYVEVQAGLMRNQETYAFLEPAQTLRFSEYWMPVRDTGGITRANLNAIVALNRVSSTATATNLKASLNVTQPEPGATIVLLDGDRVVQRESVALDPAQTWSHTWTDLPAGRDYTFRLISSAGAVLLEHTENKFDWTPAEQVKVGPVTPPVIPPRERWTAADFLREGNDLELNGKPLRAYETYEAGLLRDSKPELQKAAGRLAVSLSRSDRGIALLRAAVGSAVPDAETSYYLGLAHAALKQHSAARDDFIAALVSTGLRAAASLRLAELAAQDGDLPEAMQRANQAEAWSPDDLHTGAAGITLRRLNGDDSAARQSLQQWLARYPQDNVLRYENTKLGADRETLLTSLAGDSNRVLDLVDYYIAFAAWTDAEAILQLSLPAVPPEQCEPGEPPASRNPLVRYYLGFVQSQANRDPQAAWRAASELSARYIFPNRAPAFAVLTAAVAANAGDANAHYLFGELLFARGMNDAAISQWRLALESNPQLPGPAYCLGQALFMVKHLPEAATEVLEQGIRGDPANDGLYTALNAVLEARHMAVADRVAMLERFPRTAEMPDKFARLLIDTLRAAGRGDDADKLEREHRFFAKEK